MSNNNNNKNIFNLGTFRVEIPSVVHNADVNPLNNNTINQNGNYNIPQNYTGWNNFSVNVQSDTDENEITITLPADPEFDEDADPFTITINDLENNPLIEWNQFDEKYATSIRLELGAFIEKLFRDLKLENGQTILENGEYQIYDYEKDDDLDIKKENSQTKKQKVLKVSRDIIIDEPSYRNIGSFTVNVPIKGNLESKNINITRNGQTYIFPSPGYDGLRFVKINTNVNEDLDILLQEKTVRIENNNTNITVEPDNGYSGMSDVHLEVRVPEPLLEEKSVTINNNGTNVYTPSPGYYGINRLQVTTNVDNTNIDNVVSSIYILSTNGGKHEKSINWFRKYNNGEVLKAGALYCYMENINTPNLPSSIRKGKRIQFGIIYNKDQLEKLYFTLNLNKINGNVYYTSFIHVPYSDYYLINSNKDLMASGYLVEMIGLPKSEYFPETGQHYIYDVTIGNNTNLMGVYTYGFEIPLFN